MNAKAEAMGILPGLEPLEGFEKVDCQILHLL